jgi:hypothetical protein
MTKQTYNERYHTELHHIANHSTHSAWKQQNTMIFKLFKRCTFVSLMFKEALHKIYKHKNLPTTKLFFVQEDSSHWLYLQQCGLSQHQLHPLGKHNRIGDESNFRYFESHIQMRNSYNSHSITDDGWLTSTQFLPRDFDMLEGGRSATPTYQKASSSSISQHRLMSLTGINNGLQLKCRQ